MLNKATLKKKILVADDDPAIVDALEYLLQDAGYEVRSTIDATTVVKMLEEQPDIVLLDIWMSGQDGRDICKALKAQNTTHHIPIIMISANRDTAQIAKASGADDFLSKPFEMDDLLKKIKYYVH